MLDSVKKFSWTVALGTLSLEIAGLFGSGSNAKLIASVIAFVGFVVLPLVQEVWARFVSPPQTIAKVEKEESFWQKFLRRIRSVIYPLGALAVTGLLFMNVAKNFMNIGPASALPLVELITVSLFILYTIAWYCERNVFSSSEDGNVKDSLLAKETNSSEPVEADTDKMRQQVVRELPVSPKFDRHEQLNIYSPKSPVGNKTGGGDQLDLAEQKTPASDLGSPREVVSVTPSNSSELLSGGEPREIVNITPGSNTQSPQGPREVISVTPSNSNQSFGGEGPKETVSVTPGSNTQFPQGMRELVSITPTRDGDQTPPAGGPSEHVVLTPEENDLRSAPDPAGSVVRTLSYGSSNK